MLWWHCYAKTHTHTRVKRKRDPNSADSPAHRPPTNHFDSIECGDSIAITSGVLQLRSPGKCVYAPNNNSFTSDAALSPSARRALSMFLERSTASLSLLTAQPIFMAEFNCDSSLVFLLNTQTRLGDNASVPKMKSPIAQ